MTRDAQALLLLGVVLTIALAGFALLAAGQRRGAQLAARGGADEDAAARRVAVRLDRRLRRTRSGRRLAEWLRAAGVELAPIEFLALALGAAAGTGLVLSLLVGPRTALLAGTAAGVFGARAYVQRERARRLEAFVAQLPDIARTLSNAASAGLSLPAAIALGGRELPEPAGAELRRLTQEIELGRALDDTLEALQRRLPSREVGVLMTTLVIQHRAGGDTVRALQELGGTLEARKDLIREIRTLLAGSVFTGYVVPLVALGSLLMMNAISPGVIEDLTSSLLGITVLAIAGSLWGMALVLIRRTTRVEL